MEKPELLLLPATPYQMKRYAEVTVQQNGHVYLSCDKHYYSVPEPTGHANMRGTIFFQ